MGIEPAYLSKIERGVFAPPSEEVIAKLAAELGFVHNLNSSQWLAVTGKPVPGEPPSAAEYSAAGLPWFEYYDEKRAALGGAAPLANLDSVAAKTVKLGARPLADNDAVQPQKVLPLGPGAAKVSDGNW